MEKFIAVLPLNLISFLFKCYYLIENPKIEYYDVGLKACFYNVPFLMVFLVFFLFFYIELIKEMKFSDLIKIILQNTFWFL